MRIVFYTHVFAPSVGGVETQILSLARGLHGQAIRGADEKLEVTVLTPQPAGDFDDRGLLFRVVREPGLGAIVAWFRRADIVHLAGPSFAPLLSALALRRRVIVSHHGFQAACPNGQFFYRPVATQCLGHFRAGRHKECLKCNAENGAWKSWQMWLATFPRRWLCQCAALNIVPTRWLGTQLELPRTAVVAHGVAESSAGQAAEACGNPRFSFVGRLVSTKGVDALLAAAQRLKAKGHCFQLHVIGKGPERQALEASAKRGGLNGTVEFLGSVTPERIERELAGSLAVVVPSLAGEVFGLVAAESMMAGRAVVTSDIGALQEVRGDTGLSFPAGNAEALAEQMESLLKTPGLAARLGQQAQTRAEELYNMERMVSEHLRLYEEMASRAE
jgi:glycosyltransferase involved in cell wall biosynthesis